MENFGLNSLFSQFLKNLSQQIWSPQNGPNSLLAFTTYYLFKILIKNSNFTKNSNYFVCDQMGKRQYKI